MAIKITAIVISFCIIIFNILHLLFAYARICGLDSPCPSGPGPTYGPILIIIGMVLFAIVLYRDIFKKQKIRG
jgi:hypothetical protein